jgi:NADH dehydrogenase
VPLRDVLEPVDVNLFEGYVEDIHADQQQVMVKTTGGIETLTCDRLVFALGSQLQRPPVFGLIEHAFNVDTYDAAKKLESHLMALPKRPDGPGQFTVLVVGAGLTGIETATEMPERLRKILANASRKENFRVILADHAQYVGSDMGEHARPVIEQALQQLGIETLVGVQVVQIDDQGAMLDNGERIDTQTVIWCAGMRANPLTASFAVPQDRFGRLEVDSFLRVRGVDHVFAAGDSAWLTIDGKLPSVMSCQHGRPMGRYAGHNAVADLYGQPMLPLSIDWYTTVLDLGAWGALYTSGRDRQVVATGQVAKATKEEINRRRIYPPLNRDRAAILAAAAPIIQSPPQYKK